MADKEYIERNALIAEYDRIHIDPAGGARRLMVDAPTADVVEVVRCKDCKYSRPKRCTDYVVQCNHPQVLRDRYINYFCGYGKRRE